MPSPLRIASPRIRATLYLPPELLEEARDAAYYLAATPARMTLAKLTEEALRRELIRLQELYHGGRNFPHRTEDLKGGRPIAA